MTSHKMSRRVSETTRMLRPDTLALHACLWMALPVVVFLFGWFRLAVALPVSLLLMTGLFCLFRRRGGSGLDRSLFRPVAVSRPYVAGLALLLLLLVVCGHGGFVRQSWDWQFRNAVFFDLARHSWPVVYDADTPRVLCYYFVFFLPGALVSKLTGMILPGDIVQLLYAFWGVAIGYSLLVSATGGLARWRVLLVMIFFAGCDSVVSMFLALHTPVGEWWPKPMYVFEYYKSFSFVEQQAQIFNQTVACWLALPLLYGWRRRPGAMILASCLLFVFAPLPCVGIAAAVAWWCVREWRRLLSVETLAGMSLLAVTALFYISNANASSPDATPSLHPLRIALLGISFILFCVGVYLPFIWSRVRGDAVFWLLLAAAALLPLVVVGDSPDLGLRAGIPLTVFILYAVARASLSFSRWETWRKTLFVAVLAVGSYGAFSMLWSIGTGVEHAVCLGYTTKRFEMVGRLDDSGYNLYYNNFVAEGDSFWLRWLAPREATVVSDR